MLKRNFSRAMGLCYTKGSPSISSSTSHSAWKICRNECTRNAYLAIISSVVKNVSVCKSFDPDYIFDQGDRILKLVSLQKPLAVDEVPLNIDMEGANISVAMI